MQKNLLLIAGVVLVLIAITASSFIYDNKPIETEKTTWYEQSTDGLAELYIDATDDTLLTPLSRWQIAKHDALVDTAVSGYEITASPARFAEPVRMRMTFPPATSNAPFVFFEDGDGLTIINDVTYYASGTEVTAAEFYVPRPGKVYAMNQYESSGTPYLYDITVNAFGTVTGLFVTGQVDVVTTNGVVPYTHTKTDERAFNLTTGSTTVMMEIGHTSALLEPAAIVTEFLSRTVMQESSLVVPFNTFSCVRAGEAQLSVTVHLGSEMIQLKRTFENWSPAVQEMLWQASEEPPFLYRTAYHYSVPVTCR